MKDSKILPMVLLDTKQLRYVNVVTGEVLTLEEISLDQVTSQKFRLFLILQEQNNE